jgi:hypothetical protein
MAAGTRPSGGNSTSSVNTPPASLKGEEMLGFKRIFVREEERNQSALERPFSP